MNKVMSSTYGNLSRTDIIDGKIVCTEIKNHTEQVVNVLKVNKYVDQGTKYFIKEENEYGYGREQIFEVVKGVYGKENVSRYSDTINEFDSLSKGNGNSKSVGKENSEIIGETIER